MNASAERNLVECLLTWGPAAWGELLSLKRLYHTNYLIHVSADVEVIDGYPTNSTCRIYNVGSSEADARILVKDAEVARQVSFKVGKHWEWQPAGGGEPGRRGHGGAGHIGRGGDRCGHWLGHRQCGRGCCHRRGRRRSGQRWGGSECRGGFRLWHAAAI